MGRALTVVCAATVLAAGCGESKSSAPVAEESTTPAPKVIQPGAPGEPSREVIATPTPVGPDHKPADVEFMQGMIHHHQQAVTMADWVPDRTQDTSIRVMARRMSVSQSDEMELMRNWLRARDIDPNDHSHKHRAMPGMVNSRQLEKLKNARGKAFDRLFLQYMTQHHQGALQMIQELYDKGGGGEAEIGQFVLHVDSDQTIEIERMAQLLEKL